MATARDGLARISRDRPLRWRIYLALAIVLAVLCFLPRPYIARAKIVPQDSSSAGVGAILNSLGGQLQSFAALLSGGRPPNDLYLLIGRSDPVTDEVIGRLKLVGRDAQYNSVDEAKIALKEKVDVHLLLGGVVEVETITHDANESQKLTSAYVDAISKKIGSLGRANITRKRQIVDDRLAKASRRVAETENALDVFQRANALAAPEQQLGSEITLRANLQAQLAARQVSLGALKNFSGPENPALQSLQSEIAGLQSQIASAGAPRRGPAGPNVAGLSELGSRYLNLYRDVRFAQTLYEVYARSSEQVAVEELVAESASYIQVIEPAHLDAERHYNVWAVASLCALALLILFFEWYAPATGLLGPRAVLEDDERTA